MQNFSWQETDEYAFGFYALNLQRILLLSQASLTPTTDQAQLSSRIASDLLETIIKVQTTFRQVLEDIQSEQEEWIQAVCGTFATLVLTIPDLTTTPFESIFL